MYVGSHSLDTSASCIQHVATVAGGMMHDCGERKESSITQVCSAGDAPRTKGAQRPTSTLCWHVAEESHVGTHAQHLRNSAQRDMETARRSSGRQVPGDALVSPQRACCRVIGVHASWHPMCNTTAFARQGWGMHSVGASQRSVSFRVKRSRQSPRSVNAEDPQVVR